MHANAVSCAQREQGSMFAFLLYHAVQPHDGDRDAKHLQERAAHLVDEAVHFLLRHVAAVAQYRGLAEARAEARERTRVKVHGVSHTPEERLKQAQDELVASGRPGLRHVVT